MPAEKRPPIIAIVGRPNVGKSSLFNRLIHKRLAITSDIAGTTRDRIYYHTSFDEFPIIIVDTGGMEYGKKKNIEADIQSQVEIAIEEADLIYFVVNAKEDLTSNDLEAARKLRKSLDKIIFIANKIDTKIAKEQLNELLKLGFGDPIAISAYHNIGIEDLSDATIKKIKKLGFKKPRTAQKPEKVTNVSFLGRPNVGKSSLVNAILGKSKVIVSAIPGTTRDAIDTGIKIEDQKYNLIDTAGLRRRGKIKRGLEKLSSFKALSAIERSDIVCLVMDYSMGVHKQDQHIASYILEAGKGLILVVNKTDLMDEKESEQKKMIRILRSRFEFLPWAPVIFVSALKRKNVMNIFELVKQIQLERFKEIPSNTLTEWMKEVTYKHMPPSTGRNRIKFYSIEQVKVNPPTFVIKVDNTRSIHFSYRRYLENELRKKFQFTGTAIKTFFRKK